MEDDDNNAIHFILLLNRSNLIDFKLLHTDQTEATMKKCGVHVLVQLFTYASHGKNSIENSKTATVKMEWYTILQ